MSEFSLNSNGEISDPDFNPEEMNPKGTKTILQKYSETKIKRIYDFYQQVKKKKLVSTTKKFPGLTYNEIYAIRKYIESKVMDIEKASKSNKKV